MTYGVMNIATRWHEPGRGFFLIEEGEKVRKFNSQCPTSDTKPAFSE